MQVHCLVKNDISGLDNLMLCYGALTCVAEQIALAIPCKYFILIDTLTTKVTEIL